ncbi:MAG: hypothetical protein IPI07_19570 [Flavobacteriales bacterium]|nr:hypothetical protein [Flavobacteriales bacterium]
MRSAIVFNYFAHPRNEPEYNSSVSDVTKRRRALPAWASRSLAGTEGSVR